MAVQAENVLLRVRTEDLIAAARDLPEPNSVKEMALEADAFDESGRRVRVGYYKFTLRAHLNTWHIWCPYSAHYLTDE